MGGRRRRAGATPAVWRRERHSTLALRCLCEQRRMRSRTEERGSPRRAADVGRGEHARIGERGAAGCRRGFGPPKRPVIGSVCANDCQATAAFALPLSLVAEISLAPVPLSMSLAREISSLVSQCTESRVPPPLTNPS